MKYMPIIRHSAFYLSLACTPFFVPDLHAADTQSVHDANQSLRTPQQITTSQTAPVLNEQIYADEEPVLEVSANNILTMEERPGLLIVNPQLGPFDRGQVVPVAPTAVPLMQQPIPDLLSDLATVENILSSSQPVSAIALSNINTPIPDDEKELQAVEDILSQRPKSGWNSSTRTDNKEIYDDTGSRQLYTTAGNQDAGESAENISVQAHSDDKAHVSLAQNHAANGVSVQHPDVGTQLSEDIPQNVVTTSGMTATFTHDKNTDSNIIQLHSAPQQSAPPQNNYYMPIYPDQDVYTGGSGYGYYPPNGNIDPGFTYPNNGYPTYDYTVPPMPPMRPNQTILPSGGYAGNPFRQSYPNEMRPPRPHNEEITIIN